MRRWLRSRWWNPIPVDNFRKSINRLLQLDIRIIEVAEAAAAFHPRYQAHANTYEYRIHRGETCSPFDHRYVYHYPYPLDEARIFELAPMLEGEHDFSAYAASDDKDDLGRSKVRRVFHSQARRSADLLIYSVRGSGFLKHMVRNIVGVLLEVGKGNLTRADIEKRLDPACTVRRAAGAALGLFLVSVEY